MNFETLMALNVLELIKIVFRIIDLRVLLSVKLAKIRFGMTGAEAERSGCPVSGASIGVFGWSRLNFDLVSSSLGWDWFVRAWWFGRMVFGSCVGSTRLAGSRSAAPVAG